MADLKSLLGVAAEQQQPAVTPDFDQLVTRARRRRVMTAGGAAATVAVVAAGAALVAAHGSTSHPDTVGGTNRPSPCTATELGEMKANWALKGLVLNGSLTVRNISAASCALSVPDAELLSARGQPLLSEGKPVPVDHIAPRSAVTLPAGQSAQATLRWGGSYCGPTTADVVVKLRLAGDTTPSIPVTGPVLACLTDTTYYRHGQSSAAISGFAIARGSDSENSAPGLVPAYGQGPGAAPCDVPRGGAVVNMVIGPDVPRPRCVRIRPNQRLRVENGTAISGLRGRRVVVRLAGYPSHRLEPGEHVTFAPSVGKVLAPGLHCLAASIWRGSCADVWVVM